MLLVPHCLEVNKNTVPSHDASTDLSELLYESVPDFPLNTSAISDRIEIGMYSICWIMIIDPKPFRLSNKIKQ